MYQVFISTLLLYSLVFSGLGWSLEPATLLQPGNVLQKPTDYQEGKHYKKLDPKVVNHKSIQDLISRSPQKIQVVEFSSYGCLWCGRLRPMLEQWVKYKPTAVVYYRFPLAWNKKWEVLAKAYYVTEALGKTEILDAEFFKAIHEKHLDLSDEKLLTKFFVEHGVPEQKFLNFYQSFTVNKELARANDIANAYQIIASPVIIINAPSGSYLLTAKMAGTEQELISVLNYLVAWEAKKLNE